MSPGSLVSFMLYQQSLSSAFSMMGDVFSALTAAVGAADKVTKSLLTVLVARVHGAAPATCIAPCCALVLTLVFGVYHFVWTGLQDCEVLMHCVPFCNALLVFAWCSLLYVTPSLTHKPLSSFIIHQQVIELIKRKPRETPTGDFIPDSGTLQGSLELQNVVFAYPSRPTQRVVNGLNLAVSPGACVRLCVSMLYGSGWLCAEHPHLLFVR